VPRLTIILTSRNKHRLLRFAVESVLRQTFKDWELIVTDDASDEPRTLAYLDEITDYERVRVFRGNPVSEGYRKAHKMVAVRINAAMAMAEGEYVSYLGDDNVYLPYRCENLVHALDGDKDVGMIVDKVRWVMFDGQEADQDKYKFGYVEPFNTGHEKLLDMIAPSNYICTDSVMHRRQRPCCMNWPTDMRSHTPVDWRYWCYLVEELEIKVKTLNVVGERAYFPGTWRHGVTVEQVLATRREPLREEDEMSGKSKLKWRRKKAEREARKMASKDKKGRIWCVNVSGKRQQITVPGGGKPHIVEPDGRIDLRHVKTKGGIMEGFAYDTRVATPPLKSVLKTPPAKPKDVEYERVTEPKPPKAKRKPVPPPKAKKIAKASPAKAKSPVDEPKVGKVNQEAAKHAADLHDVRLCKCGKVLGARNKSGMCRDCYFKSFRKEK